MNEDMVITQSFTAPAISESELIKVLGNSLYPGAQTESIKMILGYCKASGLDPMQKPVHIVPIWDGKLKTMRDVVMPGIGLYRTMASRTGECAGVSEPEFGADVTETLGGVAITYPTSCRVIVKRTLPSGQIADFAATERWKENYAVKGGADKSIAPNSMWLKRPYAQLAKCAEAQALRKAFPELGSAPTADEMEGKTIEETYQAKSVQKPAEKVTLEYCPDAHFESKACDVLDHESGEIKTMGWESIVRSGKKSAADLIAMIETKYLFTDEQKATILSWEQK